MAQAACWRERFARPAVAPNPLCAYRVQRVWLVMHQSQNSFAQNPYLPGGARRRRRMKQKVVDVNAVAVVLTRLNRSAGRWNFADTRTRSQRH